jgi:hypothetical protein
MQESKDPKPAEDVGGDTGLDREDKYSDSAMDDSLRDPGATESPSERERAPVNDVEEGTADMAGTM